MASRASPGNSNHCRPSTMKSSSAVARSATHPIGGRGVMKAPMASEMPAMTKASASCFLENLRVFEDGVSALVGCSLGSVGGGVIVAGLSFKRSSWTLCLWQCRLFPRKADMVGARLCLLAPKADAALFIQLAPVKPSSLHRTRFGNHVARFSNCASCGKTGKARQPFAAFQSAGAGSTCRTLRCFQRIKLEKGRSWSLARPIYTAQLSTTQLSERTASYMFVEIFSAI